MLQPLYSYKSPLSCPTEVAVEDELLLEDLGDAIVDEMMDYPVSERCSKYFTLDRVPYDEAHAATGFVCTVPKFPAQTGEIVLKVHLKENLRAGPPFMLTGIEVCVIYVFFQHT